MVENLTINELKQRLTDLNIELPTTHQKKAFYVNLYKEALENQKQQTQVQCNQAQDQEQLESKAQTEVSARKCFVSNQTEKQVSTQISQSQVKEEDIFEMMLKNKPKNEFATSQTYFNFKQILFLLVVIILFFLSYFAIRVILFQVTYLYQEWTKVPKFCDSKEGQVAIRKEYEECKTCPENAVCQKGVMKCNSDYIQQGYICVENQQLIIHSLDIIHQIEAFVLEMEDSAYCNFNTINGVTSSQAKIFIENKYFQTRDKNQENMEQFGKIYSKAEQLISNDKNTYQVYKQENDSFKANEVNYSLKCRVVHVLFENQTFFTLVLGSVIIFLILFTNFKSKQNKKKLATDVYLDVISRFKQKEQFQQNHEKGISFKEEQLINHYTQELTKPVFDKIWPQVKFLLNSDNRITTIEKQFGTEYKWECL